MNATLYTLTSSLHTEMADDVRREPFIKNIEAALGADFEIAGADFSKYGTRPCELIYVRTGGTEGAFKAVFCKDGGKPCIPEPVRLLTSGKSNSLAASMEIMSYLNLHGIKGEILHGSPAYIAARIRSSKDDTVPADSGLVLNVHPDKILQGQRLGVAGRPSDWLISSSVNYAEVLKR